MTAPSAGFAPRPSVRNELFHAIVSRLRKRLAVLVALLELTNPGTIPPLLISRLEEVGVDVDAVSEILVSIAAVGPSEVC